jgi:hypothetical protein
MFHRTLLEHSDVCVSLYSALQELCSLRRPMRKRSIYVSTGSNMVAETVTFGKSIFIDVKRIDLTSSCHWTG